MLAGLLSDLGDSLRVLLRLKSLTAKVGMVTRRRQRKAIYWFLAELGTAALASSSTVSATLDPISLVLRAF